MLVRYQTTDMKDHQRFFEDRMGTIPEEEESAVDFLAEIGTKLRGATFYRCGVPFKSFAFTPELGLHQTNP